MTELSDAVIISNLSGDTFRNRVLEKLIESLEPANAKLFEKRSNAPNKIFNSGEVYVQIPENVREKRVHIIHGYNNPDIFRRKKRIMSTGLKLEDKVKILQDLDTVERDLSETCKLVDAVGNSGAEKIYVYFPCMTDQRADKKDEPRVSIAARLVLDRVQAASNSVVRYGIANPHSLQIQGFTKLPLDIIDSKPLMLALLNQIYGLENITPVAPDEGATKDVIKMVHFIARNIGEPPRYAIITKYRKEHGESEAGHITGEIKGTPVIFDDMIDSGGTVLNAVRTIRNTGYDEDIVVCAAHGIFSTGYKKNKEGKISGIEFPEDEFRVLKGVKVITTDSVPRTVEYYKEQESWLTVFSLAEYFSHLIYCNAKGTSHGSFIEKYKKAAFEKTSKINQYIISPGPLEGMLN